jgi:glycosyltransferase involved in cell wall biosynthesis
MRKVSVIITTYNGEEIIERTINSMITQKGIDEKFTLELIVVDDCSTDSTLEILKKFDVKLFVTSNNTGGPNKGRNIGLKNATGDYICIADQDDEWKEHRIVSLLPSLEKVPIVTSGYILIDDYKNITVERVKKNRGTFLYYPINQTFIDKLTKSLNGQDTYLGSIMFRKELKDTLFEEHFGVVDFDWILRLFHQQDSIEICDSLYVRYVTRDNLSLNEQYRKIDFYYSLMFIETYEEEYPKEVRTAYKKIHGSMARYYYLTGNMRRARFYFIRSTFSLKTIAYYLTTVAGARFVKKKFNVFG